jgi:hypothetical protein
MAMHYNTSILHIDTGVANEDNIITSLHSAISELEIKLNRTFKCPFKINIIRVQDKITKIPKTIGSGYIWIADPELYWILAGHNPDGSERYEEHIDPNWVSHEVSSVEEAAETNLWADIIESEMTQQAPMIRTKLTPLVTLPGFKYTEDQINELTLRKDEFMPNGGLIGDTGYLTTTRGCAGTLPSDKIANVLCSRFVPNWVPNDFFKAIFSRYTTDKSIRIEVLPFNDKNRDKNRKNIIDTVPLIMRTGDTVFITFDPQTRDASFARIMQRKTRIQHPDDPNLKCEIVFDYAFGSYKTKIQVHRNDNKGPKTLVGQKCLHDGFDYFIIDIKAEQIQIKNELTCELKWVNIKDVEMF